MQQQSQLYYANQISTILQSCTVHEFISNKHTNGWCLRLVVGPCSHNYLTLLCCVGVVYGVDENPINIVSKEEKITLSHI